VRTLARVSLVAGILILFFCALFAPQLRSREPLEPVSSVRQMAVPAEVGTLVATPDTDASGQSDDPQESLDLYGNDVTDAIARYKFDATGALYELHSPQTEVPRLRSPKS
jgi:hypothetical protein